MSDSENEVPEVISQDTAKTQAVELWKQERTARAAVKTKRVRRTKSSQERIVPSLPSSVLEAMAAENSLQVEEEDVEEESVAPRLATKKTFGNVHVQYLTTTSADIPVASVPASTAEADAFAARFSDNGHKRKNIASVHAQKRNTFYLSKKIQA